MKIKSIYIEKYKGFKEFNIDFNNNVNVIIGENGLGKTTILELIYDMIIGNDDIVDGNDFKECSIKALFNDEELNIIKELSGEKQIFFRGGSLLEMNLNNSIILIDEPELSLHPEWQQKILDFYKGIGENNQIIIATHSPHIVSSCKKEEVIVLGRNNEGRTIVRKDIEETYGWTVEQLLLSVFELKSVRNPEVQTKVDMLKKFL